MRNKASFSAIAVLALLSVSDIEFDRLLEPRGPRATPPEAAAASCRPGTELVEDLRYYDFFGAGAADANRSFRQRLLVSQDFAGRTRRFAGQADWHIEWRTCLEPLGPMCRISGISSKVHVTYTLPRWADRGSAGAPLGSRWDRYATNLLAHEKGHGRIALDVARMIEQEVTGLVDLRGCEAVKAEASRLVGAIMRRGEAMQNEYDRITAHGSLQGAQFPF